MGVYVFNTSTLLRRLEEDARDPASSHEIGRNLIPQMVQQDRVFAQRFDGYWQDVGSLPVYWRAQLDLLDEDPALDISNPDWVIHTRSEERPPVKLLPGAQVQRSLVSNGCIIRGQVINSVLSPGVIIEEGAIVRDSIIMLDTFVGANAVVDRAIVDEQVRIGAGAQVGMGTDVRPNMTEPEHFAEGLTVLGYGVELPEGYVVGRHCRIKRCVMVEASMLVMKMVMGFVRYMSTQWRDSGRCCALGCDLIGASPKKNYPFTWASSSLFTMLKNEEKPYLEL
jgi:glucose-1-phosphate adenylyltransferase